MQLAFKMNQQEMRAALVKLDVLRRAYPDAADAAGFTLMSEIVSAAKVRAPRDKGELASRWYVTRTSPTEGGNTAPHALPVHELPPNVKRHTTGSWKFLSGPLNESYAHILQRWARLTERYALQGVGLATVPAQHPEFMTYEGDGTRRRTRIRLRPTARSAFSTPDGRKRKRGRDRRTGRGR